MKTGEYFKKYSFKAGRWRVTFVLVEANVEVNNLKGDKRFFILNHEDPVHLDAETSELEIRFSYRPLIDEELRRLGNRGVQDVLVAEALVEIALHLEGSSIAGILRPRSGEERPLMEKHLRAYVGKNTRDYFINKDLKGFLERELDFYMKNEVWSLDDLESLSERSSRLVVAKAKAIREISLRIIEFLSQIEEFQKKLFEKKKFVFRTDYCITLDLVPEELYEEIGRNENQVAEWKELYKLDEITKGTFYSAKGKTILNVDFLKQHKHMVLDTKFFSTEFKDKLLEKYDLIDNLISGLLIKSENFQALNLIKNKFKEKIKCIYIDPPFNTGSTKILYKNEYEHSSWICLIENRIPLGLNLLVPGGILEVAIDDYEGHRLRALLDSILGSENRLGTITVLHNPGGRHDDKYIATCHEYLLVYSKDKAKATTHDLPLSKEDIESFKQRDINGPYRLREFRRSGSHSTRKDRPNMWYPIYYNPLTKEISVDEKKEGMIEIYPIDPNGIERVWRWGKTTLKEKLSNIVIENNKGEYVVKAKLYLEEKSGIKPKSVWIKSSYSSALGTTLLKDLFGKEGLFTYPKSLDLVMDALRVSTDKNDIIMDYFAGSGTTAHAVLQLNYEEKRNIKYILIEMGDYFDTTMKQRVEKIIYSIDWKEGKPRSKNGVSHCFKYHYLEQYEDTLNNIEFIEPSGAIQKTLESFPDYFVSYMLDYETRGSSTRLAIEQFKTPFNYRIKTLSGGEEREEPIDLVETFNYLLGLNVNRIRSFKDGERVYRSVFGESNHKQVAVIWRDTPSLDLERDKCFIEETILVDPEFDTVYVNGDSYVKNAKPIEPEFRKRMYDEDD